MSKAKHAIPVTEVLLGHPVAWPKPASKTAVEHVQNSGAEVIYEDDDVIAYFDDDDAREGTAAPGERRISISPKNSPPSLMDIDISDGRVATQLLYAVQQVTFKLGLHKTGFEIRANVLPPYQERPFIRLKIRTGDPKKSKGLG